MKKKIGLVLSGGGVRAAAHIGVIRALKENGIHPDCVSGSSAGALVGALYAAGFNYREMLSFFQSNRSVFHWWALTASKPGIFDISKYRNLLEDWFPEDRFDALHCPLHVAVTDVLKANAEIISEGPLIRALLASSAFPVVFTPLEIDGSWYVDGGVMNNFPVEPFQNDSFNLIGSYASSVSPIDRNALKNSLKLLQRVNELGVYAASRNKFKHCAYVFHPNSLFKYNLLDTNLVEEIYEIGYVYALEHMETLLTLLGTDQMPTEEQMH